MGICIDRCLCFRRSFQELKNLADQHQCQTLNVLAQHATFGQKCGLCLPYIARMLHTGETIFHEIITAPDPCALQYEYEKHTEQTHLSGHESHRNSDPCDGNG